MIVPEALGIKSGIPPGNAKLPLESGGGYIAMVQVFHQLHCLNLLRKATWYNYNYYNNFGENEFASSEEIVQIHVGMYVNVAHQRFANST